MARAQQMSSQRTLCGLVYALVPSLSKREKLWQEVSFHSHKSNSLGFEGRVHKEMASHYTINKRA